MLQNNIALEKKIIDSIRGLAIDMIDNAKSGHPGIALGAAPILYTLYSRHINFNVKDDKWINRDRFVMSCGHGSALLYSVLYFCGFNISLDSLRDFRKIDSVTPGHPEFNVTSGVDMSTGPLGQGFASAVGMAIAERFLNKNLGDIIDNHTYVLCSDGDLMEGVSYEAASLAGTLKLGKLIVLYDSNNVTLDGGANLSFTEDVLKRFEALGWHTQLVTDGERVDDIDKAILKAKMITDKPSIIEVKTILGRGSIKQGTNVVHGSPLTSEDIFQLKEKMGLRNVPFAVSAEAYNAFIEQVKIRCENIYTNWKDKLDTLLKDDNFKLKYNLFFVDKTSIDLKEFTEEFVINSKESGRDTNGKIMNIISNKVVNFLGGSADLSSSTKTNLFEYSIFSPNTYDGKNIYFGVREHAMGAILNGMALSNLRVFGSTFLVFSDFIKPAIRLSAIMDLPVTYVFTHDSITIGQDGPTHQPVEQLTMLRSIPNFSVYRPADAKEILGSWNSILSLNKPCAIVVSRSDVSVLENSNPNLVGKGAYIIRKETARLSGILIATGSEVEIAINIADELFKKGIDIRVISMPNQNLFNKQSETYKESLIPIGYKTMVIEYGSSYSWYDFVYNDKYLFNLNDFGKSGSSNDLLLDYKLDIKSITDKIEKLLK